MRWWMIIGMALLLSLLPGCGGGNGGSGGQPERKSANLLTVNYLDARTVIPQAHGSTQVQSTESYEVSTTLRVFDALPVQTHLLLDLPATGKTLAYSGPYPLSSTDGTYSGNVPIKVYWGSGQMVPDHQPYMLTPGMVLPGYQHVKGLKSMYICSVGFDSPLPISGTYTLSAEGGFFQSWETPATQQVVAPVTITDPQLPAVNALQPLHISWEPVPGAIGYLVIVDSLHDQQNVSGELAEWSSAPKPIIFEAIDYHVPYLLPASVHEVTVPATIFRGCKTILVRILAHGDPYFDTKSTPNLRLIGGAMTSAVYGVYEE